MKLFAAAFALGLIFGSATPAQAGKFMHFGWAVPAPAAYLDFCRRRPDQCAASTPTRVRASADLTELLENVNHNINIEITEASDQEVYGVPDYWNAPLDNPTGPRFTTARGDCEDFALQKREELIEAGVPPGAITLAAVNAYGSNHAVLVVATTDGDIVLDNLLWRPLPWFQLPYRWIRRQAPGGGAPTPWRYVGDNEGKWP